MKVREIGYEILDSIYKNNSYSNIELNKRLRESDLSTLDKAFLTRLIYGTLKENRLIDYEINHVCDKTKLKPKVRTLLKLSVYQLRFMDKVPSYAIINEAVDMAKERFGMQTSKFVNAVLRRLTRETFRPNIDEYNNKIDYYCTIYSFPNFIGEMLNKQIGFEKCIEFMEAFHLESPLMLRVNYLKATKKELLNKGLYKETDLDCCLEYIGSKPLNELDDFLNGKVCVQGRSSQEVSLLLDPSKDDLVLDMCAAPGGKTYHLADLLKNSGKIYSFDLHEHRISLLVQNLPRLGIRNVIASAKDSTNLNQFNDNYFDKVLLDAPCSGLGVARRKPDILLKIKQEELGQLYVLQRLLIDEAVRLLKVNGTLVYSTCTINKKENEEQIKYLLNKYPNMVLELEKTIYPSKTIIDGFFMAKLKKVK